MAYKTFANGFPLPASDLNNYLMNQSVIVFADSAARTAALPTPTEGMITYLEDTNTVEVYDGAAWTDINDNTAAIPKSTVTTAGDLIVADGASSVTRLGVGTADQVLSTDGTGVSWSSPNYVPAVGTNDQVLTVVGGAAAWADASAGGGMTLLSSTTPSGTFYNVTSIPGGYKELVIDYYKVTMSSSGPMYWRAQGSSNNAYATRVSGTSSQVENRGGVSMIDGTQIGFSGNFENSFTGRIMGYSDTTRFKSYSVIGGSSNQPFNMFGQIQTTSAITTMQFVASGSFTGGKIDIYGVN